MRRMDLTFTVLRVPLDFFSLLAAGVTAYALRTSPAFTSIRPILTHVPFAQYLTSVSLFVIVWMVIFALAGLYTVEPRRFLSELGRITVASTAGIVVVISTVFFRREVTTSRFLILAVWALSIFFAFSGRLLLRLFYLGLLRARIGHQRLALVGSGKPAEDLNELYRAHPVLGFTVVKRCKTWNQETERQFRELAKKNILDGILLADTDMAKQDARDLIAFAESEHLGFRYLADLFAGSFKTVDVTAAGGIPVIEVKRTPLDGWGRILKRVFDIAVSAILIAIFSPLMIATAIAIKLNSRGPVLFSRLPDGSKTERMGEGGKPFPYFKFRSMKNDLHWERYGTLARLDLRKGDPLVKLKRDPRVTSVGRFIRAWSIDELPELFLVLIGRMSLVGPRPHLPEEVARYKPHERRVMTIKPGITGITQVSGRASLSFEEEVALDTWYIEHWSPWLDLYILWKTPWVIVTHKGVEEGT